MNNAYVYIGLTNCMNKFYRNMQWLVIEVSLSMSAKHLTYELTNKCIYPIVQVEALAMYLWVVNTYPGYVQT